MDCLKKKNMKGNLNNNISKSDYTEHSIFDLIKNIKDEDWDYRYKENRDNFNKAFIDNHSANTFIDEYYGHAGKEGMPLDKLKVESGVFPKAEHTASVFFFGAIVYHNCFPKDTYLNGITPSGYRRFPFIWFLSCLFHDIASDFENSGKHKTYDTLDKLKNDYFNIKHDLIGKKIDNISQDVFDAIGKYYDYRIKDGKIDHGIAAGVFLYDGLVKNRILKKNNETKEEFWNESLDDFYAQVSAAIASHNIWLTNDKAKKFLKDNGIKDLEPIKHKESPLLFLLGLVDTLDPLKIYKCITEPNLILKNVYLTFTEDDKMRMEVKEGSPLNPQCIKDKIKDLDWLDIKVDETDRGIELCF